MNHEQHPLDRRFGQALRRHEQAPRPEAWKRLEARLGREEETRRIVPFWAYGVAASVSLLLLAGIWWARQPESSGQPQPQVATNQKPVVEKPAPQLVKPEPAVSEKTVAPALPEQAPQIAQRVAPKRAVQPSEAAPARLMEQRQPAAPAVKPEEAPVQVAKAEPVQPSQPTETPKAVQPTLAQVTAPAVEPTKSAPTTLVVTLANTGLDEKPGAEPSRRRGRLGRILRQLNNAKHGDRVDWNEVGINPPALLARAEEKIDRSTDKVNETYRTLKDKSAF
jgi:hypothetical protein